MNLYRIAQALNFYTYRYFSILKTSSPKEAILRIKSFINRRFPNTRAVGKTKLYKSISIEYENENNAKVSILLDQLPKSEFDEYMFRIGKNTHLRLNNHVKAQKYLDDYFDFIGINVEDVLYQNINQISGLELGHQFVIKSGTNNIGTIVHSTNGYQKYLTKVCSFTSGSSRLSQELLFYKELLPRAELLSKNTPNCVLIQPNKNIAFLTMEYIHGRKPQIDDIDAIKEFQQKCIRIGYKEMPYLRVYNVKGNSFLPSLFLIHSHYKPQRLPMKKLIEDIKLLHKLFIKRRVLNQINIKRDFVLQQGDFEPHNIKIDDEGKLMVYDWEGYGLNIPGSDLLTFILVFTHDFNYIKEHVFTFLSDEGIGNYNAITCYLTLQYLNSLVNQPEGVRIEENWNLALDYLRNSPLNG